MKAALTIAGSDSCGGAGIQVDLKVFTVLGVYGMSALTAVTAQNTTGVRAAVELDAGIVRRQIDAVAADIPPHATKSGMLSGAPVIEAVADAVAAHRLAPYVCDPVMVAKSGDLLLKPEAVSTMARRLFPLATVVTPNLREAAVLTSSSPERLAELPAAQEAARRILGLGTRAVVVKGIPSGGQVLDLFYDGSEFLEFVSDALPRNKTHGSGCAFSAAIAAGLATGLDLIDAIDQARKLVSAAIRHSPGQGRGTSPVNVLAFRR